jgi:NADH:ubiquinone oxidoreductase subunit C
MNLEELLATAEKILAPWTVGLTRFEGRRLDVVLKREGLVAAVAALADARWGYLSAITGLDLPWPKTPPKPEAPPTPPLEDQLEVLYHFVDGAAVVTLRLRVPYSDARVPSICGPVPTATLYERELHEMFGIEVEGTPVTDRLLLPDDWPDGVYPLRKSFKGLEAPSRT